MGLMQLAVRLIKGQTGWAVQSKDTVVSRFGGTYRLEGIGILANLVQNVLRGCPNLAFVIQREELCVGH